jgi:hypothetical protein
MRKRTAKTIALSEALLISGVVGTRIVSTDGWLWAVAPTHAYGLIAFVAMDIALIAALWRGRRFAIWGVVGLALVQFFAMAGDLAGYAPLGASAETFRSYLLNNSYFTALLAIQPIIAGLGIWSRT